MDGGHKKFTSDLEEADFVEFSSSEKLYGIIS